MYLYTLLGPEGEAEEAVVDWSGTSLSGQDSVRLVSFLKTASQVNHVLCMSCGIKPDHRLTNTVCNNAQQ